ncbi:MAG: hypothetical protein ACOCPM_00425 [Bacteroidales bacterium]
MKYNWLLLLLLIPFAMHGQDTLKTKEVPENVRQSFERRNRNAENTVWVKENDNYIVSYENRRGVKKNKHYNKKGEMEKMVQKQSLDNIRDNMMEYIDDNYPKYKPYEVYYIEKGRRDRYYSIYMHHKKADDPPNTEIQFNQSGQFITVENLYIPDDEKEDPEIDEDFAAEVDRETEDLKRIEERKVKKKNLPSNILEYIDELYPHPYRMKSARLKNTDKGPMYIVIMKIQGKDHHYKLTFDFNGDIQKDEKIYEED